MYEWLQMMTPLFLIWGDDSTSFNEIIVGQCEEVYKSCCASSCLDSCGYNILQWCFIRKLRNQMLVLHSQSSCRWSMQMYTIIGITIILFHHVSLVFEWQVAMHCSNFRLVPWSFLSQNLNGQHGMLYWSVNSNLISPLLIWLMYCPIVVFLALLLSIWKLNVS